MTRRATTCALSTLLLLAFAAVPAFGQTAPGDLIITEYMADPSDVGDSDGEYFEIYNDTGSDIDLSNFTFAETDGSGTESFSVNNPITDLIVESGTFYVLCKNGDDSANGGVTCDDDYPNRFSLNQGTQTVTVTDDRNSVMVFKLEYDDGDNFGDGISHELMDFQNGRDGTANGPTVGSDYQAASQNIDGTGSDQGSPGSQGTTIPVEFAGAPTARVNGNAVTLFWRTLTETNNAGFHVQHRRLPDGDSQPEGSDWTTAEKRVEGAGTTQTEQRYDYTVTGLRPGRYVFRVRQVDTDDDESFSQRVRATVQASSFALQAPRRNPFRGQTTLHYRAPQDLDVEATLYNSLGQQVRRLDAASGRIAVEAGALSSGLYFVRITTEKGRTDTRSVTLVR